MTRTSFEHTWTRPGPLGFEIVPWVPPDTGAVISVLRSKDLPQQLQHKRIDQVGTTNTSQMSFEAVLKLLRESERPVSLTFSSAVTLSVESSSQQVRFMVGDREILGGGPDRFGRGFNLVVLNGERDVAHRRFDTYASSRNSSNMALFLKSLEVGPRRTVMIATQDTVCGWGLFAEGLEHQGYNALAGLGCEPETIMKIGYNSMFAAIGAVGGRTEGVGKLFCQAAVKQPGEGLSVVTVETAQVWAHEDEFIDIPTETSAPGTPTTSPEACPPEDPSPSPSPAEACSLQASPHPTSPKDCSPHHASPIPAPSPIPNPDPKVSPVLPALEGHEADGWQLHPQELVDWTSLDGSALLQSLHAYVLQTQIPLIVQTAGIDPLMVPEVTAFTQWMGPASLELAVLDFELTGINELQVLGSEVTGARTFSLATMVPELRFRVRLQGRALGLQVSPVLSGSISKVMVWLTMRCEIDPAKLNLMDSSTYLSIVQTMECIDVRIELTKLDFQIDDLPGLPLVDQAIEQVISDRVTEYVPTLIQEAAQSAVKSAVNSSCHAVLHPRQSSCWVNCSRDIKGMSPDETRHEIGLLSARLKELHGALGYIWDGDLTPKGSEPSHA